MTKSEAKQIAKELLEKGQKPVDVIASAILAQAEAEEKANAILTVHNVEPIRNDEERQQMLQAAVSNSAQFLYTAFQSCGVPQQISTVVNTPEGPFELIFKRKLNVLS